MQTREINTNTLSKNLVELGILIVLSMIGMAIFQLITVALCTAISGKDYTDLILNFQNHINTVGSQERILLHIVNAIPKIGGFVVVPILYLQFFKKKTVHELGWGNENQKNLFSYGFILIFIIAFFPSLFGMTLWNESWTFFEGTDFGDSMKQSEAKTNMLMGFLINFENPFEFILGFITIGVLAAITEEIMFRGFLQNKINLIAGNPHVAIWITAFIFSAIHGQFYGLLPRMVLGAIFGYLYFWSGNLWHAIFAHFLNNGIQVVVAYLASSQVIDMDPTATPNFGIIELCLSVVICAFLLKSIRKFNYRFNIMKKGKVNV